MKKKYLLKNKISDFIYVFIYLFFTVFHISNDFY